MTSQGWKTSCWLVLSTAVFEVNQEIPMHLCKAVAEVLAYVFKVHKRMKRQA